MLNMFEKYTHYKKDENNGELKSLFNEFYDRLVYFSFQIVKDQDQANDIAQESFIKYWNQKEFISQEKASIKNYLYSSVRNLSLNQIRHNKVVAGYAEQHNKIELTDKPVIEAIITSEVIAEIHTAIQSLPENYRIISLLSFLQGKKNQEIADELGMSINTVKKQKQRALQLLKLKLTPETFMLLLFLSN